MSKLRIARLERENAQLRRDVQRLNAENRQLRRQLRNASAFVWMIQNSYENALQLAIEHVGYQSTSRAEVTRGDRLSKRQWERAVVLLKMAGIHSGKGWKYHTVTEIEGRLSIARQQAMDSEQAYRKGLPTYLQ